MDVIIRATPGVTTSHLGRKSSICEEVSFERLEDKRVDLAHARLEGRRLCRKCAGLVAEWVDGLTAEMSRSD
jgi:hypothetical protein